MFRHYSANHRAERAPTAIELWAKHEAKSATMAADLLTGAQLLAARRAKRIHRYRYAAVMAIVVITVLASIFYR